MIAVTHCNLFLPVALQNAQAGHIPRHAISEAIEVKRKMTPVEVVMTVLPAVGFIGSFVVVRKVWASISHSIKLA